MASIISMTIRRNTMYIMYDDGTITETIQTDDGGTNFVRAEQPALRDYSFHFREACSDSTGDFPPERLFGEHIGK